MNNIYKLKNNSNNRYLIDITTLNIYQRIQNIKQFIKRSVENDKLNKYFNLWDKETQTIDEFLNSLEIELIKKVEELKKREELELIKKKYNCENKEIKPVFKNNNYRVQLLEKAINKVKTLNNKDLIKFINNDYLYVEEEEEELNLLNLTTQQETDINIIKLKELLFKFKMDNEELINNNNLIKFNIKKCDKTNNKNELINYINNIRIISSK